MSDWHFLNQYRVTATERNHRVPSLYFTTPKDGFTGMFRFPLDGQNIRCIASDFGGWKHVSVSLEYETKTPTWKMMCSVKDLFWALRMS
jgi:hypothetical protein